MVVEGPAAAAQRQRSGSAAASGSAVFLRVLVGKLGTPKLAQSFAYGK